MVRRVFCLFILCLTVVSVQAGGAPDAAVNAPTAETPNDLTQAWLRFHETELCQEFDADFVFSNGGMEVRSFVEDEKAYQKFEELLAPLRSTYRIDLQAERPPEKEDPEEEKDPPASLWENYELRAYLGDPFARAMQRADFEERPTLQTPPPPDDFLKQRLMIYSEQTTDWGRRLERYGKDIPVLTRVAADPALEFRLRSQAKAVCMAHLRNMERYVGKLNGNLSPALPRSRVDAKPALSEDPRVAKTPIEQAEQLADYARAVSRRVHQFIHPEQYTVGLDELRQPGLLESLKTLHKMNSEFRKSLAKIK